MIAELLRLLGVDEARPDIRPSLIPRTDSEQRYERVRREAEQVITQADRETYLSQKRLSTWNNLYLMPETR